MDLIKQKKLWLWGGLFQALMGLVTISLTKSLFVPDTVIGIGLVIMGSTFVWKAVWYPGSQIVPGEDSEEFRRHFVGYWKKKTPTFVVMGILLGVGVNEIYSERPWLGFLIIVLSYFPVTFFLLYRFRKERIEFRKQANAGKG